MQKGQIWKQRKSQLLPKKVNRHYANFFGGYIFQLFEPHYEPSSKYQLLTSIIQYIANIISIHLYQCVIEDYLHYPKKRVLVVRNVLKNVPVDFWTWLENYRVNTAL